MNGRITNSPRENRRNGRGKVADGKRNQDGVVGADTKGGNGLAISNSFEDGRQLPHLDTAGAGKLTK